MLLLSWLGGQARRRPWGYCLPPSWQHRILHEWKRVWYPWFARYKCHQIVICAKSSLVWWLCRMPCILYTIKIPLSIRQGYMCTVPLPELCSLSCNIYYCRFTNKITSSYISSNDKVHTLLIEDEIFSDQFFGHSMSCSPTIVGFWHLVHRICVIF